MTGDLVSTLEFSESLHPTDRFLHQGYGFPPTVFGQPCLGSRVWAAVFGQPEALDDVRSSQSIESSKFAYSGEVSVRAMEKPPQFGLKELEDIR